MRDFTCALIIALLLSSCKSETVYETQVVYVETPVCAYSEWCGEFPEVPEVIEPDEPDEPEVPPVIEPPEIIEPPEPEPPVFELDGLVQIDDYEYVVIRDGAVYMSFESAEFVQDFVLPDWAIEFLYKPYLELILTDGNQELCARYDWSLDSWGDAEIKCLYSQPRHGYTLDDIKQRWHGFRISESRVWVSGVSGVPIFVSGKNLVH